MTDVDLAIIGAGLIGAAAARHAATAGVDVAVIGPEEPADPATDDGPFASHHDSGRITRHLDASPVWAELAARSIAEYPVIEAASEIDFHRPVGVLWADRSPGGLNDLAAAPGRASLRYLTAEESADQLAWSFTADHELAFELAPAGFVDPRRMVRAQLVAAEQRGAVIVRNVVEYMGRTSESVTIGLRSGDRLSAEHVIVAAGAYSAFLLADVIDLPLVPITAAVILGEVTPQDAAVLNSMPAMIHRVADGDFVDVYAVPPVQYPDGRWYIKLGAEELPEVELPTPGSVNRWMAGTAEDWRPHLLASLTETLPAVHFVSSTVRPCMYARTPSYFPYVDRVAERIVVAAGGNGRAAKSADAIGSIAADLASSGTWRDPLAPEHFRVPQ
jgi:sarcosine oxidase